jgi:hypothetical protein
LHNLPLDDGTLEPSDSPVAGRLLGPSESRRRPNKKVAASVHKLRTRRGAAFEPVAMASGHDVRPTNTNGVIEQLGPDSDDADFES